MFGKALILGEAGRTVLVIVLNRYWEGLGKFFKVSHNPWSSGKAVRDCSKYSVQ
jgi:hypothetical protein